MWKRMQQSRTGRLPTIGDPLLIETTLDENAYGPAQRNLRDIGNSPQDGALRPERPQRPKDGLPNLPPSLRSHPYTGPSGRPPSTVYAPSAPQGRFSRPWVDMAARTYGEEVEISPPSSPDIRAPASGKRFPPHDDVEVSPVDEVPDVSMLRLNRPQPTSHPRQAASNIPTLRRERRRNNFVTKSDTRERNNRKSDTRWDSLTGEPTTSDRGRPQQVRPSEFVPPGTIQAGDGGGGQASRQTGPRTQASFGDRVRKQRENTIADRPEWKGSSGRTAIVPVVTDQPDIPVHSVRRKVLKRAESPQVGESNASGTRGAPVVVVEAGIDETAVASQPTSSYAPRTTGAPVAPMAASRSSSRGRDALHSTGAPLALTDPRALSPDNYTTKPLPPSGQDDPRTTPDDRRTLKRREESTSTIEQHFRDALKDLNIPTPVRDQPVSRFSISTYATTAAESTPRVSIDQSPSIPSTPPQQSPLFNRSRPRAGGNFDASKATMRKAVPNAPVFINMPGESRPTSKTLPKSPAEAASVDLVSSLQAQLDNLAHQRRNLQRCIHQMTELMPIDMLARGMEAQRQAAERKKVEVLKEHLAEVIREEHELGLRLHRAYKRMDDEAVYEPTTLWVRRVTG